MDDCVSQAASRATPSLVSGLTHTTSTTNATAAQPRTFCVVCGSFSGELALRKSGLKCPKCIGKKANRHWVKLQKQQATQLLCQVTSEEQQQPQTLQLRQPQTSMRSVANITPTESSSYGGPGGAGGGLASLSCSLNPDEANDTQSDLTGSHSFAHSGGRATGRSGMSRTNDRAATTATTTNKTAAAPGATSHPINDYISKTTVYKAAVHRATHSTQIHDDGGNEQPPSPLSGPPSTPSTRSLGARNDSGTDHHHHHEDRDRSKGNRAGGGGGGSPRGSPPPPPRLPPRKVVARSESGRTGAPPIPSASHQQPPTKKKPLSAATTAPAQTQRQSRQKQQQQPAPPAHPPSRRSACASLHNPPPCEALPLQQPTRRPSSSSNNNSDVTQGGGGFAGSLTIAVGDPIVPVLRTDALSQTNASAADAANPQQHRDPLGRAAGLSRTPTPVSRTQACEHTPICGTDGRTSTVDVIGTCDDGGDHFIPSRRENVKAKSNVALVVAARDTTASRTTSSHTTHVASEGSFRQINAAGDGVWEEVSEPPPLCNSRGGSVTSSAKTARSKPEHRRRRSRDDGGSTRPPLSSSVHSGDGESTAQGSLAEVHAPSSSVSSSWTSSQRSRTTTRCVEDSSRHEMVDKEAAGGPLTSDVLPPTDDSDEDETSSSDSDFFLTAAEGEAKEGERASRRLLSHKRVRKGNGRSNGSGSATLAKPKTRASGDPASTATLYPLCVDGMTIAVTVPLPPPTAALHHSRTESNMSITSTGSSSNRPYGYAVKSRTVVGCSASAAADGKGSGGSGGSNFTVTRLTPVTRVKRKSSSPSTAAGKPTPTHQRSDSNLSHASVGAAAAAGAGAGGVASPRPIKPRERGSGSIPSSSSSGGINCSGSGGGGKSVSPSHGNEGVEVKKIRYVLHVMNGATGVEAYTVERGYFTEIIPALEAVKKLARKNCSNVAADGGGGDNATDLPVLPSKRIPSLRMATEAFVEERRAETEAFLAAVCGSPFYIRHPSIVSLLKLGPYLRSSSSANIPHAGSSSVSCCSGAAVAGSGVGSSGSSLSSSCVSGSRRETLKEEEEEEEDAGGTSFLSDHALDRLRDGTAAEVHKDSERLHRSLSLTGSIQSTGSSVVRRSRLDCVTPEDLATVQLGNLLGRGTFGSVFLGLIQTVNGPLMLAVKELQVSAAAAGNEHAKEDERRRRSTNDSGTSQNLTSSLLDKSPLNMGGNGRTFTPQEGGGGRGSDGGGASGASGGRGEEDCQGSWEESDEFRKLQGELDILRRARHKNVTRFLGSLYLPQTNTLRIFTEYVECGTIHSLVRKFGAMPLATIQSYLSQILAGLRHLHDLGIVHRDIKGENVLVTKNGRVKLSDFGCSSAGDVLVADPADDTSGSVAGVISLRSNSSQSANLARASSSLPVGTPLWMAPEVINGTGEGAEEDTVRQCDSSGDDPPPFPAVGKAVHFAADVWALGCVGVEMLDRPLWRYDTSRISSFVIMYKIGSAGTPPHGLPTVEELEEIRQSDGSNNREAEYTAFSLYRDFLTKCFLLDPRERWTVAQLQQHPFLHTPLSRTLRWMPPPPACK